MAGRQVRRPDLTVATVDHNTPTWDLSLPITDEISKGQLDAMIENTREFGIPLYDRYSPYQGIVHVIGPDLGYTLPGKTVVCGDSHTSTHGALGCFALGIGTSEVEHVLATQTLRQFKPRTMEVRVNGQLPMGVVAKDVILGIIGRIGIGGGVGHVIEYTGEAIRSLSMDGRMTVCNMSIEGGALVGYVNPDDTTYEYLLGRPLAPKGEAFDRAVAYWRSMASDPDARYDDVVDIDGSAIEPTVTWGINPGQAVGVLENMPRPEDLKDPKTVEKAYQHMGWTPGAPILGTPIDVAFIGSCTNSRFSDLVAAARVAKGGQVSSGVRALVVPGSVEVKKQAEAAGLDRVFTEAGFQWREAGCSMCLAMNPDKLQGREVCASSSNRNFIGRQGSPEGRTLLMSPAMVAAAALNGKVVDVRDYN